MRKKKAKTKCRQIRNQAGDAALYCMKSSGGISRKRQHHKPWFIPYGIWHILIRNRGCADDSHIISGGCHEACSGAYAFLFWDRNDASFVHSGDIVDPDLYHWVSDVGVLSVLLLDCKRKLQKEQFFVKCMCRR